SWASAHSPPALGRGPGRPRAGRRLGGRRRTDPREDPRALLPMRRRTATATRPVPFALPACVGPGTITRVDQTSGDRALGLNGRFARPSAADIEPIGSSGHAQEYVFQFAFAVGETSK